MIGTGLLTILFALMGAVLKGFESVAQRERNSGWAFLFGFLSITCFIVTGALLAGLDWS